MLPLYGIGRTFSTHDGFVKIGCWRWHKKKPPEGAQSADKVRGAGAFPVAQSRALPDGRAHGFAALANIGVLRAGRAQPLYLLTPAGRFALRATAHWADASLRCAHGFAALANIGVLRAGRAQPLYLLTPPGRFALRATAHRADASLRRAAGRFGPSAQVPTGHALPFAPAGVWSRAPKPYAAAFSTSVASVRRTQETRLSPNSGVFQRSEPPEGAWHLGKVMVSEGTAPILHSFASKTEYRTSETPRCKQPESAGIRPSQTG